MLLLLACDGGGSGGTEQGYSDYNYEERNILADVEASSDYPIPETFWVFVSIVFPLVANVESLIKRKSEVYFTNLLNLPEPKYNLASSLFLNTLLVGL